MDIAKMTELWADFVFEGKLSPEIRYPISDAWQKCRAAGVNPSGGEGRRIDINILESARKENQMLISLALPVMREIFEIVRVSGFLVVLTDAAGYILEMMGDDEIISKSNDMRFMPGAKWSNLEVGTNAISLALDYDMPIQTIGPEHYCVTHHGWTCSAAPIHDVYGEVVGCINLSGDREKAHLHTLGMAQAAAIGIEGQLREARNALMMHKVLESSQDCILLFDQKYAPTWMNSAAKELLKCELDSLREKGIQSVIPSADLTQLKSRMDESFFSDNVAVLVDGETIYCSITVCPMADRYCAFSVTMRPQTQLIQTANKLSGNRASYTFHNFLTENEKMKKTLSMAERFARYEGNILIQGESGTGKEVLAQAIHNAGANADGPFVTVNCASIPLDLFEMELFGYDPVAFPGRAAEGKPGRFELADKGTLFLDAVSAIPLDMQIKLLQAVETHTIQRLGSNNPIKLDIRIIAASSQDLAHMAERGMFRKDLYYRLSPLTLEILPLRSRPEDILLFAERYLQELNANNPEAPKTMTQEFVEGLQAYDWPGNVRELQNSIARAYYSDPGPILTSESLQLVLERPSSSLGDTLSIPQDAGEGAIVAALTICGGNVDAAAERLGISRATLYRRMKKYGIIPKLLK